MKELLDKLVALLGDSATIRVPNMMDRMQNEPLWRERRPRQSSLKIALARTEANRQAILAIARFLADNESDVL